MASLGGNGHHPAGANNGGSFMGTNGRSSSFLNRFLYRPMFGWLTFLFRTALWPLQRISDFLLPLGEYEGLSTNATEGASKAFTNYLTKTLSRNNDSNAIADIVDLFSMNSYTDVQREAANTDALILVYLYSPYHRSSEEVCRKLLCSQPMVRFLSENKERLKPIGSSTATSQGASLSYSLSTSSFPMLALLQPVKKSTSTSTSSTFSPESVKLVFKAEGHALMGLKPTQLAFLLTSTFQKHERTVLEAATRRYEREQEAELRRQQDEEYQETLRQDQERERIRTEARLEAEREEQRKKEEEERKANEEINRLENAKALLREEPPRGTPGCARIRFRLPNGKQLDRRFEGDETIASLKAFLILHFASEAKGDVMVKRIALSTNFPKRTYGGDGEENDDDQKTLQECELCPQAVLMVQDLDA